MNISMQERNKITQHHSDSLETVSTASAIFFQFHFIIFISLSNAFRAQMECILIFLQHFLSPSSQFGVVFESECLIFVLSAFLLFYHHLNGEAHKRIQFDVRAMDRARIHAVDQRIASFAYCHRHSSWFVHQNAACVTATFQHKNAIYFNTFLLSVKLHCMHFLFAPRAKNLLDFHRCCCCCNFSELLTIMECHTCLVQNGVRLCDNFAIIVKR